MFDGAGKARIYFFVFFFFFFFLVFVLSFLSLHGGPCLKCPRVRRLNSKQGDSEMFLFASMLIGKHYK